MNTSLRITATLSHGIAHASPWTISLDGLLASQLWQEQKRANPEISQALAADNPPDLDLPLARCLIDPEHWHWAATCGWPNHPQPTPEIRHWASRLDHRHVEHTAHSLPRHISAEKGRWKAYYMPLPVTLCTSLTWHAHGDKNRIQDLLQGIVSIGKKRSQGEGRVSNWVVEEAPELDLFTAAHLSPSGELARPCPLPCLENRPEVPTGGLGFAAIRPPHMHPSRRTDAFLPAPH